MAKIGLKNFYYSVATENATTGVLTYSGATKPAKAISFSFEPTVSDAVLYADDAVAEQDTGVTGGSCTMGVDRLDETTLSALLTCNLHHTLRYVAAYYALGLEYLFDEQRQVTGAGGNVQHLARGKGL